MPDIQFTPLEGYLSISQYVAGRSATYEDFDRAVQSGLNLFALREDFDFDTLEETLDLIISAMPSIKRIFAKPIIRLRDSIEILPAEAVHTLDSKSLSHLSVHSEQWENVENGRLKPRKLMTIRHKDDYAIYENIVFVRLIEGILRYVSANLAVLRDMLYANRELRFNLLERENHPLYFLALGKLHMGYLRDYDKYRLPIGRCYEKLNFIYRTIRPRLSSPIYKSCRKKGGTPSLQKTNIFRSQKDYRRIYRLKKHFLERDLGAVCHELPADGSEQSYFVFCSMLTVFAAGHFNFKFDENERLDFNKVNARASFAGWDLKIEAKVVEESRGIMLTVSRDRDYRVFILPTLSEECDLCLDAEEIIAVSPVYGDALRVSLYDIESFRRIQQVLLRAMICSDEHHEVCPFCGKPLRRDDSGEVYECGACRTLISACSCPESGKEYYRTDIAYYKAPVSRESDGTRERAYGENDYEGVYKYRNITPLDAMGRQICPVCGKRHT